MATSPPSSTGRARSPKRRAVHLYIAMVIGVLALIAYAMLRVGLCWGRLGILGEVSCKSHYLVWMAMAAMLALLVLLVRDLGSGQHAAMDHAVRFKRGRAALAGYKRLERNESIHVAASGGLALFFVVVAFLTALSAPVLF